ELAAVNHRDAARHRLQRQRPVDRRVATADDDDVLVAELVEAPDEVVDATPLKLGNAGSGQALRLERADASADNDGPRPMLGLVAHEADQPLVLGALQCANLFTQSGDG